MTFCNTLIIDGGVKTRVGNNAWNLHILKIIKYFCTGKYTGPLNLHLENGYLCMGRECLTVVAVVEIGKLEENGKNKNKEDCEVIGNNI